MPALPVRVAHSNVQCSGIFQWQIEKETNRLYKP